MSRNYLLIFLLINLSADCVDIGSDSSVQLFNNQVTLANGDRIAGFAALNGGFLLQGFNVTGTFDSFFTVAGNVQFNAGTMSLNQDLIFQTNTNIISLGNIRANNHDVHISSLMNMIPSGAVNVGCAVSFITTNTRTLQVNTVAWSYDSQYVAIGTNQAVGDGLVVFSFDGTTLTQQAEFNFVQSVNSVAWHPTKYWLAIGIINASTDEIFTYSFTPGSPGTLTQLSSANIAQSVFSVAWHPNGNFVAAGTGNNPNRLQVFPVNGSGILGTPVRVNTGANVNVVDFNIDGTFLLAGCDNNATGQIQIYSFTTAPSLTLNAAFTGAQPALSAAWNKTTGTSNYFAVGNNGALAPLNLYSFSPGTITFIYNFPPVVHVIFGLDWNGQCLAAAIQQNNDGLGGEIRTFLFDPNASPPLIEITDIEIGHDALAVAWSSNGAYLAAGIKDQHWVNIYQDTGAFINTNEIIFSDINLFIHDDFTLNSLTITFSGTDNGLNGLGHSLTLDATSKIRVQQGANLIMQNIRLEGVGAGNIVPCDSTSTFSFHDVVWVQDNNYSFTQGRFDVLGNFTLQGDGYSFIYNSNQKSRILANGNMIFDSGITFSYDPIINSNALLQLTSINSTISLNSATIATGATGLQLTTGLLSIDGLSFLMNGGATPSQGIIWGDGVTSANNLQLEWQPAANLQLVSGFLIDNNV